MTTLVVLIVGVVFGFGAADVKLTEPVKLPEFSVQGFETTYEGTTGNVYLGVPYAQAPVEERRFEKPSPLNPSNNLIKALDFAPSCYMQEDVTALIPTSEDCLYLNVLTPTKPPPPEGFPVLFWIHGGGFNYGGTVGYGFNKYIRDYISRDIVYVNFQYRLSFWGFFTTNSTEIPGNYGHWDQLEALKFVKRNIAAFGGNPNQITVGGHSAGSASANSFTLSPHTRDLFNYSIQQSGGTMDVWALRPDLVDFAKTVAKNLGCGQTDDKELKKCMKEKSDPMAVLAELKKHPFATEDITTCPWTPILDDEFFDGKTVPQLLAEAPVKPVLYTIDTGEGLIASLNTGNPITSVFAYAFGVRPEVSHLFTRANFTRNLERLLLKPSRMPESQIEAAKTDILYNFIDVPYDKSNEVYFWRRFTDFVSQIVFEYPMLTNIRNRLNNGWNNQYVLIYDYVREVDISRIRQRLAPHGYEYYWLAECQPYFELEPTETPYEVKWRIAWAENIAHFVHHGKPKETAWPAVSSTETIDYLIIGQTEIETGSTYFEPVKYWDGLLSKYDILWTGANKQKMYAQNSSFDEGCSNSGKTEL
uniref:Carboxylic ester hydrolase n=1 Tax=Panagrellus redivivus TaxID=6233 RepID=A0A7E4VBM7_PANRE